MSRIFMMRRGSHLEPINAEMEAALLRIQEKKEIEVVAKQKRNAKHNALYFSMLHRVADWLGQDDVDIDVLHEYAKLRAGVVSMVKLADGTIQKLPGSTAFDRLDQVKFSEFFEKVVKVLYTELQVPPDLIADLLLPKEHREAPR